MPRRTVADCTRSIKQLVKTHNLTDIQADELLTRMDTLARARVAKSGLHIDVALKQIEGEITSHLKFEQRVNERNRLLTIKAKRDIKERAKRAGLIGEGLQAILEGTSKVTQGGRLSVDYQSRALYHKYFGGLMAELESKNLVKAFRSGKIDREIYIELGELNKTGGAPGRSGNAEAQQIAEAWNRIHDDMVTRQNQAGAFIRKTEGYIMKQTHDTGEIRALGRMPDGSLNKQKSFNEWSRMVSPLLDHAATFKGAPPADFLEKVHANLYSGVYGKPSDEAEIAEFFAHGSMARSASAHRVLHFKDAESAFMYNQMFGTKNFSDGIMTDLLFRSRNITLMENFGPNPHQTFKEIVNDLRMEAREMPDAAEQVARLEDWRIRASWAEVAGENEYPSNLTLDKVSSTIRTVTQLSKMGGVVLSSLGDKAFLQSEMLYQGISAMETFARQITGLFSRSSDQKQTLHLAGIALDSMIGNTISRYTIHSPGINSLNKVQQRFYGLNLMNWWNDVHKSTAGELMGYHLGLHDTMDFAALPADLQRTLSLYDIGPDEWEAIRTLSTTAPNGEKVILPMSSSNFPINLVDNIVRAKGLNVTPASRSRIANELDSKLRTYFTDRIDIAVPTPGAAERKFLTLGTQAGTPLGEVMRMLTMFKSFPTTVFRKVLGRDVYGRGAMTIKDWFLHDSKGKFAIAQLIAMTTVGGYLSGVLKDGFKGRTPKPLTDEDGNVNWATLNDSFLRGGGAGIMGDFLFTEYDRSYKTFSGMALGPVFGQVDMLSAGLSKGVRGENPTNEFSKLLLNNTPFLNLFYIRPVLDYYVLWNMQNMLDPNHLDNLEKAAADKGQEYFINPQDAVK